MCHAKGLGMHQKIFIKTKDGLEIGARSYAPENRHGPVLIIAPSAKVSQNYYFEMSCYFQKEGYHVLTFDYRGVGDSAPVILRGFNAKLDQWAMQDTDAVIRHAKNHFPVSEIIFIGHGIGGEIVGLAPASQYIHRLVLVNSGLSCSRLRQWKDKLWIGFMKIFVRSASWLFGYFPGQRLGVLNDLPKGVMDEWIHWCNNDNGLFDDFSDHNYRKLQIPLLAFSFSDDWRSQQNSVRALLGHFTAAHIKWYHVSPIMVGMKKVGHSGFFKTSSKKIFWNCLLQWIKDERCNEDLSCESQALKK